MILTEMALGGSSIREVSWFQSAVSGVPFSSAATADSWRATKQHSTLRGVLSFTPWLCKVSHSASVKDRCALSTCASTLSIPLYSTIHALPTDRNPDSH